MRAKTAVVVGARWGDEGKGKIVHVLSERFAVVARYAGGYNAGHTASIKAQKFILQLVPCGILRQASQAARLCHRTKDLGPRRQIVEELRRGGIFEHAHLRQPAL